ncbi:hypothetical protein K439DRAFT_1621581 [Ramaria rubella]|nr:hypothetical protein K439DRAFT_1621581 [Ramaria rubella]
MPWGTALAPCRCLKALHSLPPHLLLRTPSPVISGFFGMSLGITGSYPLPELPLTFQAFLRLYFLALLSSELLVVVKIILLFLLHFSELDKCKCITIFIGILLLLNVIVRKNVPESPQRHSGDLFVQPPIAGSSHIPNPQPLNPSPRDQVADICAQLAAIQQQQPPPAGRRQQSAVQTASGVNNVPLGTAEVARMCAQANALQQRQVAFATTTATTAATSTTASSTTATITTTCT